MNDVHLITLVIMSLLYSLLANCIIATFHYGCYMYIFIFIHFYISATNIGYKFSMLQCYIIFDTWLQCLNMKETNTPKKCPLLQNTSRYNLQFSHHQSSPPPRSTPCLHEHPLLCWLVSENLTWTQKSWLGPINLSTCNKERASVVFIPKPNP